MKTKEIKILSAREKEGQLFGIVDLVVRPRKNKFNLIDAFYCKDKGGGRFNTELKVDIFDRITKKKVARTSIWFDSNTIFQLLEDGLAAISRFHSGEYRKNWSRKLPDTPSKEDFEKICTILEAKNGEEEPTIEFEPEEK